MVHYDYHVETPYVNFIDSSDPRKLIRVDTISVNNTYFNDNKFTREDFKSKVVKVS